mgnify:CR=1 FL=1
MPPPPKDPDYSVRLAAFIEMQESPIAFFGHHAYPDKTPLPLLSTPPPINPPPPPQDPDYSLRLAAFTEICDKVVSENIFSQYMYKTLPTCNQLWLFKKYFCSQMALSGEWEGERECVSEGPDRGSRLW